MAGTSLLLECSLMDGTPFLFKDLLIDVDSDCCLLNHRG